MGHGSATVSVRIGVFGAPGTGKSALVAALLQATDTAHAAPATRPPPGTAAGAAASATDAAVLTTPRAAHAGSCSTGLLAATPETTTSTATETTAPSATLEAQETQELEHTVVLSLGGCNGGARAKVVVVDVPGVLCTRDTFGETLGHLAREEQLLQGDLSDDDDDDDNDETATTTDTATAESGAAAESGATLAMVCDAFVVCYDPGAPETLDAAADLLPLLAAPRDPLPVRGVLCATHSDCAAASAALRAAHRRARAEGARLAAHSGLAHCTAAARDPASAAACFRAAVAEAQRAIPTSDDVAAEQCCRDLASIVCACTIN